MTQTKDNAASDATSGFFSFTKLISLTIVVYSVMHFRPLITEKILGPKEWDFVDESSSDQEKAMFKKFSTYYDSVGAEKESVNLTLTGKTNWKLPEWAKGIFFSTLPSEQEIGGQKYNHWFEGLGRLCSFRFENGEVKFTSKMLKGNYYNEVKAKNGIPPAMLFTEPTPQRWTSYIPGMNMKGTMKGSDNTWVAIQLLADKKTFVGTTDSKYKVEIDIKTMETKGLIKYADDHKIMNGVTHSVTHSDGSVVSIGLLMDEKKNYHMTVYRMFPNDHLNRKIIAQIPLDRYYYQHALTLTENHALFFLAPVYFDKMLQKMISGYNIGDMWTQDSERNTQIAVVNLNDGKVKMFDAKDFHFAVHFSQSYETQDGKLVVEVPTYKNSRIMLDKYHRKNYTRLEQQKKVDFGNKLYRFTLDLKNETLDVKELYSFKYGNIDFCQINQALAGKAAAQYTYFIHLHASQNLDETYNWPIKKFDAELGDVAAIWAPPGVLAQEPQFIADPNGTEEDDGILLVVAYNFLKEKSGLYVIDAKTMKTLQEYPLPYKLPQGFHAEWFHADQYLQS